MVAIRNIDRRDPTKKTMYGPDLFFLIYDPYTMCDLVIGSKIIHRSMGIFPFFHKSKKLCRISARQKNRACVGITDIHMTDAVLLLIFSCKLMLFDHTIHVIINRADTYDPGLGSSLTDQFIQIIVRFLILDQDPFFLETIQIFPCLLINHRIIKISFRIQIHLRTVYMEKRFRIFFPDLSRFLSADYVIGKCSHLFCFFRSRSYCPKCLK